MPVKLDINVAGRLAEPVEVAACYAVSETPANAVKHSGVPAVEVEVAMSDGRPQIRVSDEGTSRADEAKRSRIVGLRDRVEALGGIMVLASPVGGGTAIRLELPVPGGEGSFAT